MKIIGIAGSARSGKTLSSELLLNELNKYNNTWEIINFADPIKEMLKPLGLTRKDIEHYKTIKHPILQTTTRHLLQTLGTEWGRNINKNMWINVLKNNLNKNKNYIIGDVRFENEVEFIKQNQGKLIYLYGRGGINSKHPSETSIKSLNNFYSINNNSDVYNLLFHLQQFLKENSLYDN